MTTEDSIIALFCEVDDHVGEVPGHSEALLWPSEFLTCKYSTPRDWGRGQSSC